ncbi:PilZ domain-containing protein [Sphingomonas daechungensis]|uniref:PilZ domain-containing protein n=1 Tax=Sphingomonas daechungensis TaxID=1176646 RepID=A0ABX6SZE0_9SPHN|nr:PilZ domain-containing protein [Sphingomonas daechungensis]QNP42815.1 PilZ domain-containing protein [Sphingomonas daechungensis]
MFGSLIRRREIRIPSVEDGTFDSTTFSLSTAVPRPSERRNEERVAPMLRVAKLDGPSGEQLIRVRNVSAGGLMAEAGQPVSVGDEVSVELSSQKIPGSIVWIREGTIGVKFDQNIDLGELLAGRKPRHGFRSRPPDWKLAARHRFASTRSTTPSMCTTCRSAE